jgi:4-hydroxy-tetrahydrodipicolinate reductase
MSVMKLVVTGAAGRMGQALIRAIALTEGVVLHAAIERKGAPQLGADAGELAGAGKLGIAVTDDPLRAFAHADGVLDFTIPAATVEFAGFAAQARIVHVIGTTGCSAEDDTKISAAARHATIIKSGNYSLGVNILSVLIEKAAKALSARDFDIEVLEMHHKHKVDAPSGTALLLGGAAAKGRGISLTDNSVRVRDGHPGARTEGSIGFATLRGGSVAGDHSVIFAGEDEQITLSHHAVNRDMFARGALTAARWGQGRKPGLFSMRDVLDLND